jgi:preprotein translocase subunit SecE
VNRETKRLLQRQGQIGPDGEPLAAPRQVQPRAPRPNAPRQTPLGYFRDVRAELRKVAWPTRLEVRNYSTVVIITLAILITLIFILDTLFTKTSVYLFK